jgi:UDP-2-acetamido-2-deoxy-ribo-hexuluronate aminotransferase
MTLPFFSVESVYQKQRSRLESHNLRLFERCDFVNGSLVQELEEAIQRYTGSKHAVAVGNASDGLTCALEAAGVGAGDEVVVPAMTFVSSASSVIHAGARPVFADISRSTYGLDPGSVEKVITRKTRALVVVHLFHQPADLPALLSVTEKHGLSIIEDSAESIGMRCDGKHTGIIGRFGVLSFFPTKTLGAFGDAGMILAQDACDAAACRQLGNHGRDLSRNGVVLRQGHGSRMDSLQAAILLARLEVLNEEIECRARLAHLYCQRLKGLEHAVQTPAIAPRNYPCNGAWYVYVIECDRRDDLAAFLLSAGIGTESYYPLPLHLQPAFRAWGHRCGEFPVAEQVCARTLALPLYPGLTESQVDLVCNRIADFYGGRK